MKHWYEKYISMPYKKWNCSKFVEHVLRDHFNINFNFPQTTGTIFAQSELIKKSMPVFSSYPNVTNNPIDGDLVLMHGKRLMCHVGLYLKINNIDYVLHSESSIGSSCLHKIRELRNYGYSLEGIYKWQM